MRKQSIHIDTKPYLFESYPLGNSSTRDRMVIRRQSLSREIYVFSKAWVFAVWNLQSGGLAVVRDGRHIEFKDNIATFMPPLRIVEFLVSPIEVEFRSITSNVALPAEIKERAVAFPWRSRDLPGTADDALQILMQQRNAWIDIERRSRWDPVVQRAKSLIDLRFPEMIRIEDIAARLNISREHLSRLFKREVGISPKKYLTNLQLDATLQQMIFEKRAITYASLESGFSDLSDFNRRFKKGYRVPPSKFTV